MPSVAPVHPGSFSGVIKFTNCLLVKGNALVNQDLWISSKSGKVLNGQEILYEYRTAPEQIVDLGGRVLSPGLIDTQLNGAYGFDFSVLPDEGTSAYAKGVHRVNRSLVATGVTSYLPTLTSQLPEVYQQTLPFLGPSGAARDASYGSESLGAHCEGPFLSPTKNGIHNALVLREPTNNASDLEASPIKLITLAPELTGALSSIPHLNSLGIHVSIGHSEATYEEAKSSIKSGARMITHLFNAMRPLHHRNPGIFGLLGTPSSSIQKPYFGIIADGIHLHPTSIKIAWNAHPDGLILVTDAMGLAGMPDGTYDWTNGSRIVKQGPLLTLEENGKIAGSSIQLVDCEEGADADLVVLDLQEDEGGEKKFVVDEVWKFGVRVFDRTQDE